MRSMQRVSPIARQCLFCLWRSGVDGLESSEDDFGKGDRLAWENGGVGNGELRMAN